MFHRFDQAVRLAVFGLLAMAVAQPASAEEHLYEGAFTLCTTTCDSFAALGGPGGAANPQPSEVTGSLDVPNSGPNQSFSFAETDNIPFGFEILNTNVPLEPAEFDGDTFVNPTTANPLPLSPAVVALSGSGTTDANGRFNSGEIVARFTAPPFSSNGAQVYFNLTDGSAEGYVFGVPPIILFTQIAGEFSLPPGAIDVSGAPVTFADTALGETDSADVTVTNTGSGNLTVESVATVDTLADPFSIGMDDCTGESLEPMADCVIQVVFAPTTMGGDFTDSFDIVSNDPDTPSVTVDVGGTALEPNLEVTPDPLTFVQTSVGDVSQAVATVTNTGTAELIIDMIDTARLDSQFSVALDNCTLVPLIPEDSCEVTMEFEPQSEGVFTSEIDFLSNDADMPTIVYDLQGEGIIGTVSAITVNPESLTFDEILAGEMAELSIQVNSSGNDPLELFAITRSGDDEISQENDCPASPETLESGTACTINVVFAPLSGGSKSALLTIDSNANATPMLEVTITASAFAGPRIVVEPTELDLGSPSAPVDVGDSTTADVTVSNTGTSDLTVGSLIILDEVPTRGGPMSTEFTVASNGCAMPVAPQGNCTITVEFAPSTDADKFGRLFIESDDADTPSTSVGLTGYVFRGPRVDVPETTVDIDGGTDVEIGQTADFDLVISNSGTENLEITGFDLGGEDADEFSLGLDTCVGQSIAPDGSCTVTITFTPTSSGEKSAELSIFSNDVTLVRAMTIVVQLTATATAPQVEQGAAPGSETVAPPAFALADPGGGSLGVGLLGLGLVLLIARRRYR